MLLAKVKLINMNRFVTYANLIIIIMPWLQSSQQHPHNSHNKHDEVSLLCLNTVIKPHSYPRVSWRFESIYNLSRGENMTTRHMWVTKTPWVAIVRDDYQWVRSGPTSPKCMSSMWYLDRHLWVAHILSWCTSCRQGRVSSNSATVKATKFVGPHKSHMC
jgi:hypothetical protein